MRESKNWMLLLTDKELADLHHALRRMSTYPFSSKKEKKDYTKLADEFWFEIGRRAEES